MKTPRAARVQAKRNTPLKKLYSELMDIKDEYEAIVEEGDLAAAKEFLDERYPPFEERMFSELGNAGIHIERRNGFNILMPESTGVYGRIATQLLLKDAFMLVIDFRTHIEADTKAFVILEERRIALPFEILLYPHNLAYSVYHELHHMHFETNRKQNDKALGQKVRFVPPRSDVLHIGKSGIVYDQGFLIEELLTFHHDRLLLSSKTISRNPESVALSSSERIDLLEGVIEVHQELIRFSIYALRRIDECLMGIKEDYKITLSKRKSDSENVVTLHKKDQSGFKVVLKLNFPAEQFGSIETEKGKEQFSRWLRDALIELDELRNTITDP